MDSRIQGKRLLVMAPVVSILIALLFSCALYPMANGSMTDIPVAIVSADQGVEIAGNQINAGATILENIQKVAGASGVMKFNATKSEEEAIAAVKDGGCCAALIIPADFTAKQMSAATSAPMSAQLEIYINQGEFGQTATIAEHALTTMIDKVGESMRPEILKTLQDNGIELGDEQAAYYIAPISSVVEYFNPVESSGSAIPVNGLSAMMTWIVSLISGVLLYMYYRKEKVVDLRCSAKKITTQIVAGLVCAVIAGLTNTLVLSGIIGFELPFGSTFLFIALSIFSIVMLIIAVLRWTGIGGVAIFILIMFLSMSTASLPYEMLPAFWQEWVYPWAPIRLISGGLREVFYVSGGWFNSNTISLLWISVISISVAYLSLLYKGKKTQTEQGL